jgi:hypothetical protein
MKTTNKLFLIAIIVVIISCKKDTKNTTTAPPNSNTDNYPSVQAFFSTNNIAIQTYTIDASTGGSFTSLQGTTVTIPPNAFLTKLNVPVTGNVTIQFKDIYKKSDMFLESMPTVMFGGAPLISGGEFFIKAVQNNAALILASGQRIDVSQPSSLTGGVNAAIPQKAFVGIDSSNCSAICTTSIFWVPTTADSVKAFSQNYIFSLYQFRFPEDSGSWCNSDNSTFFASYPQTTLTLAAQDSVNTYGTEVFLFFKNQTSMVHVYNNWYGKFSYSYAPQGLQCTAVAVGIKGGKLYSSFTPITIGANQTVPFALSATTTSTFIAQLKTLD